MSEGHEDGIRLTEEQLQRRRRRSVALAWALAAFAVIVLIVTVAHLGGNVVNRPI